jgi:hypothetical protein
MNRTRSFLLTSSLAAVVVWLSTTACGSSKSADPGGSQQDKDLAQAHDYYVTRVHNAIGSCVDCHSGKAGAQYQFMATDPEQSYQLLEKTVGLVAAPATSPLVKYTHTDPTIQATPDQRSILTTWLSLEANARSLAGAVPKPKSITDAYKKFADCMNRSVWDYYRMGDLAFAQTDAAGPCLGCHSTGQGSAWMTADSQLTFEKAKIFPYIQKFVVGKLDDLGSFEDIQPSQRFAAKADEICTGDENACHPRFGLGPNIRSAIDGFVNTTLQALQTGTCANGIVVSPDAGSTRDAGSDGGTK